MHCRHHRVYCLSPRLNVRMVSHGGIIFTGENRETSRETYPSPILPTTYPTLTDPGANRILRSLS
jgi:hypothetical protein